MDKAEVGILAHIIKSNYPGFDKSPENIDRLHRYLRDFPFEEAAANVRQHILTEKFPPNVAEIRGRLGEKIERERMQKQTEDLFAAMDAAREAAVPPPAGLKESIYARLGIQR